LLYQIFFAEGIQNGRVAIRGLLLGPLQIEMPALVGRAVAPLESGGVLRGLALPHLFLAGFRRELHMKDLQVLEVLIGPNELTPPLVRATFINLALRGDALPWEVLGDAARVESLEDLDLVPAHQLHIWLCSQGRLGFR